MGNCIELYAMMSCLNESTYVCIMSGITEIMSGYVRDIVDLRGYQHFNIECIEMLLSNTLLLKIGEEAKVMEKEDMSLE